MLRVSRPLALTQVTENKEILSAAGTENPIFSLPTLLRPSAHLVPGEGLLLLKDTIFSPQYTYNPPSVPEDPRKL